MKQRRHGPIPLDLEPEDRRWLASQAHKLGVRPSDVCAYLIRAARKSGLSAKEAGQALIVGQRADDENEPEPSAAQALMDELDDDDPADRFASIDHRLAQRVAPEVEQDMLKGLERPSPDEIFQRELAMTDAQIEAEQQRVAEEQARRVRRPAPNPTPMQGRQGIRRDIVQLYAPGSLSEPAGFNDRLASRNDDDPKIEIIKTNYQHLRAG